MTLPESIQIQKELVALCEEELEKHLSTTSDPRVLIDRLDVKALKNNLSWLEAINQMRKLYAPDPDE